MKKTPEMIEEICGYLAAGNSITDTCTLAGISRHAYYEWIKDEDVEIQFKQAAAQCKARNIAMVQKAAQKTWQAAAWWLERKFKDEFGRYEKQDHNVNGEVNINFGKLPPD